MIRLENISKKMGNTQIIEHCSLTVEAGEAVCLCGPSGIGKTTLLEIAALLTAPDTGFVRHESAKVGCAFQDDALVPWLGALDNILLVLRPETREPRTIARRWLDTFGLNHDMKPTRMSGGMRRRLSLARAFAVDPDILLLDEPFAFLDEHWQALTASAVEQRRTAGSSILLVSHQERHLHEIKCRMLHIDKSPIQLKA